MTSLVVHNEGTLSSTTSSLGSLIKSEDSAHVSGDNGVMALAVRNALDADLTNTERDYSPIAVDAKGRPRVIIVAESRTHNLVSSSASGTIPAGIFSGSVMNVGAGAGTLGGVSIPAGVSIPLNPGIGGKSAASIAFDASGTTFLIQYWN